MMPLPKYDDYIEDSAVAKAMNDISRYAYTSQHQPVSELASGKHSDALLSAALEALDEVLRRSGIHHQDLLKTTAQELDRDVQRLDARKAVVTLALEESRNKFTLLLFDDRLVLSRDSSSFRDFYEWYLRFMPLVAMLEASIHRAVERVCNVRLVPVKTQHEFRFIFSNFVHAKTQSSQMETPRTRNVEILSSMIQNVPDVDGRTDLSKQKLFRLDLHLSRRENFDLNGSLKTRNCWYIVEAPFNEDGRYLSTTFTLKNASMENLADDAEESMPRNDPFDVDYSEDYRLALFDFLRDRAFEIFMAPLLDKHNFATARQM